MIYSLSEVNRCRRDACIGPAPKRDPRRDEMIQQLGGVRSRRMPFPLWHAPRSVVACHVWLQQTRTLRWSDMVSD